MKIYPLGETLKKQCQYDPIMFAPICSPAQQVFIGMTGETGNNSDGNISYMFFLLDGQLWCRWGTFLHTPSEGNPNLTTHNLIGDVRLSVHDLKTLSADIQRVVNFIDKESVSCK